MSKVACADRAGIVVDAGADPASAAENRDALLAEARMAVQGGGPIMIDLGGGSPRAHALQFIAACRKSIEAAGGTAQLSPRAEAALRGD